MAAATNDQGQQAQRHTRRGMLKWGAAAAIAAFLNPGHDRAGNFHLTKPADAWVQIAMLALSAISAFSKSGDGGIGAYLSNLQTLGRENIRLTHGRRRQE